MIPIREERPAAELKAAGLTRFTTIDFPGCLSAVVFVQGCPWKCVFCQNKWMQPREFASDLEHSSWGEVENLLLKRRGLLDAVVFSGGEPTIDPSLPAAVARAKELGYKVGLHTSGAYPRRLSDVLANIDWIGLDVKADPRNARKYAEVAGVPNAAERFLESYGLIKSAGTSFELRTTAHPSYLGEQDLLDLADWLSGERIRSFALQIYRRPPMLLGSLSTPDASYPSRKAAEALKEAVEEFVLRRE